MNPYLFISKESSSGSAVAVLVADLTLEHVFDRYILYTCIQYTVYTLYILCILYVYILYIHSNLTLF